MRLKFWKKAKEAKPKSFIREWYDSIVFAVIVATFFRWSVVQAFVIPTPSMENSLLVGDYLFVSKLHYGAQTPRTPLQVPLTHQKIWGTEIPSYLDWIQLPTYRLPGLTHVRKGDVVVFYIPPRKLSGGPDYPLDLKNNYVKRCVAVGGDTIRIIDSRVIVNNSALPTPEMIKFSYLVYAKDEISKRNLSVLDLDEDDYPAFERASDTEVRYLMFLTDEQVRKLKNASYITSITRVDPPGGDPIFPLSYEGKWSGTNYGPLVVPAKDMQIEINDSTLTIYGETIRLYEHNNNLKIAEGILTIEGRPITQYAFKQNYYFMMGDNRNNSLDSRYWGFVPEDHIVGKALFIWFSTRENAGLTDKVRWGRIGNLIH